MLSRLLGLSTANIPANGAPMRTLPRFGLLALIALIAACGTTPVDNTGNVGVTTDTAANDTITGFGDVGGTDAVGSDSTTGDATAGDTTNADGGCERDADCKDLTYGVCQAPKCNLATGQCFVAEEDDNTVCDDGDACTDTLGVCKAGKCAAASLDCDDGKACTTDGCEAVNGCTHVGGGDGNACDDGNACTKDDGCDEVGDCKGDLLACDDGKACTIDSCDPSTGCVALAADGSCDDDDACTENDTCKDGDCIATALDCDDGNPCTTDSCAKGTGVGDGGCASIAASGACDDGNACTEGDACAVGTCAAGAAKTCDDSNPCTDDACDIAKGCTTAAKGDDAQCDDGTSCTKNDACKSGTCEAEKLNCDDKNPCTTDTCDAGTGCVNTVDNSLSCDDGDACTGNDACADGKCGGKAIVDCEDNNPCTTDSCNPSTKDCNHDNNTNGCDDGNACTQGDVCTVGTCVAGAAISCNDSNPCTDDSCDKATGACVSTANTDACDDNDVCTTPDVCKDTACVGGAKDCDDGKPCTDDSCDKDKGDCVHKNVEAGKVCDDGSLCTSADACEADACKGTAVDCDDGNPCTNDACDNGKGCVTTANAAKCDDGDACTTGDACKDSACAAGGGKLDCDDDNACTDNVCDNDKGCVATNNASNCDDDNACTATDACTEGKCIGSKVSCADGNACTTDKCDDKTGCSNTPNTNKCTDSSVCTVGDICDGNGKCTPGKPNVCDDGNPCTTDSCDAKTGCVYTAAKVGAKCDDGNACTINDACAAGGKCAGAGKSCDDNNACTVDSCANNVCSSKPAASTVACTDGDTCTQKDTCDGKGKCVGADPVKCDDNNVCTTDACVNGQGCKSTANTVACEDGKWCTLKDVCKAGSCVSGTPKDCEDGNSCTADLCDEVGEKCANFAKPLNTPCDDANLCSTGDACTSKGICAGKATDCNDENPCTADACDTKTGKCAFTLGTLCGKRTIPNLEPINYLDSNWHLTSSNTSVKWAADNTPATPGSLTNNSSLNFNNGTNYDVPGSAVSGTALTKYLYDATLVKGAMTLVFYSFNDVEASANYDERLVELSTDGFVTTALTKKLDNTASKDVWVMETLDIGALKGKVFQLRFRFDSKDAFSNKTKGWFVDDVAIYAGPVVKVTALAAYDDDFKAANDNGWHMSAQYANNASVWALDKTPSPGGYADESLNFNDGVDFASGTSKAAGWVLSPVIDLTGVTSGSVTLMFKSYFDSESSNSWDKRWVEVSSLAFGGGAADVSVQMDNAAIKQDGWRWEWIDLTKFKGQRVRVRFRFDSISSLFNTGKGWFIDDLRVDNAPMPVFGDMITLANKGAWTVNNAQSPVGWNVDTTGEAPLSANGSLNFNGYESATKAYNYVCPAGKTKVTGTATSQPFVVVPSSNATAKYMLSFEAFLDVEATSTYDIATVEVRALLPNDTTFVTYTLPKTSLGKWATMSVDISKMKGKPVFMRFLFDSVDCQFNGTKGVHIENIMVRADK